MGYIPWGHKESDMTFTFHTTLLQFQFSSVAQSCPTLCNPMVCGPLGSAVHGDSPGQNTGVGCLQPVGGSGIRNQRGDQGETDIY